MSHFVLTVCLPDEVVQAKGLNQALTDALHPFDENERVPYYKHFEDGGPEEHWFVSAMRRDREEMLAGTGIRPHDPTVLGWSSDGPVRQTEEEQREEQRRNAEIADRLGEHPTWELVAKLYNERYHPNNEVAVIPEEGDEEDGDAVDTDRLHFDEETGRAFTWTSYNPESKWDWWVIGGRWQRRLIGQPGIGCESLVIGGPGTGGDNGAPRRDNEGRWYCDGGQIVNLDLEQVRAEAARRGLERYEQWYQIVEKYGQPPIWRQLIAQVEAGEITAEQAREEYNNHPAIREGREAHLIGFLGDPDEEYGLSRKDFIAKERNNAAVGYALLTMQGTWTAPGKMGWFGMSSDSPGERDAFKTQANKYLDALPSDAWIVNLDCHI